MSNRVAHLHGPSLVLTLALILASPTPARAQLTAAQLAQLPPPSAQDVEFSRDIKPILEASCVKCHGRGKAKGGFKLDTRIDLLKGGDSGPAVQIGNSQKSYLVQLVSGLDPDEVMPLKGSKLTPDQVGKIRSWIDHGLQWDANVTFARPEPINLHPRTPELPTSKRGWEHPVDRLLETYFATNKVPVKKQIDDRAFVRRVHLDVIGLLPEPAAMDGFLADKHSDKRGRLVASLLADNQRYAEHWLTFWNDLLRNDYKGTGYIDGGRKQISTWLFQALYRNVPYNQMVSELIHPEPDSGSAGFTKGIVWRGTVNASQLPPVQAAQNISQVFMGVNLKCASCHDSFINDWALADAYALANIYADKPLEIFQCDKPTGQQAEMRFLYPQLGAISADATKNERTKQLAKIITAEKNGRLTRTVVNRLWAMFLGRGLVEPVDDMEQHAWHPELLDWLAEDFAQHGYDLRHTMKRILTSRAYQLLSVNPDLEGKAAYVFKGPIVRRMSAEQFRDAIGSLTGVWYPSPAKGIALVVSGSPEAHEFAPPSSVKWIWNQANAHHKTRPQRLYLHKSFVLDHTPTNAWAVAACDNSYQLYLNGKKILSGKNWEHPNLVSLQKHLRKGTNILAVAAVNYTRENKAPEPDAASITEDENPAGFIFYAKLQLPNQTLTLGSDRSWSWSGQETPGWNQSDFTPTNSKSVVELGTAQTTPWNLRDKLGTTLAMSKPHTDVRASLVTADPLTRALGRPNREQVVTSRASPATTLQALELTNGDTLDNTLKQGAELILAENPDSPRTLVSELYARALGRKPTRGESRLARKLLSKPIQPHQVQDLLWALAMLPEFQLIY